MSPLRVPGLSSFSQAFTRPVRGSSVGGYASPALDLLRERRESYGQRTIQPLLEDRRSLLLQGATLGAGVFGVVLAITALVFLRLQIIRAEIGRYSQVEAQNAELTTQLGTVRQDNKRLKEVIDGFKKKLTDVRPTSALLADLQIRVPAGIQLQTASTTADSLELTGLAVEPEAFSRINALQLELRSSPLFLADQIKLKKIERSTDGPSETPNLLPTSAVTFAISAPFANLPPVQMQQLLIRLGAEGMARRFEVLRQEGLIQ